MQPQLISADSLERYCQRVASSCDAKLQAFASGKFGDVKAMHESPEFERVGQVAVITISGMLAYEYDFWLWLFEGTSYSGITSKVRAAADDSGVTKIVLKVNSPGGSVVGCLEASNAIYDARAKKQVVAVVDPEAASAGYWLASQANRIVCMESGWVGSIGCETDYRSMYRMMKDLGVDVSVIRSDVSPDKNIGHPMEEMNEDAKAYFKSLCDFVAGDFVAHVARGRSIKEQQVISNYGQGRMLFGRQALQAGMIDAIGGLRDELAVDSGRQSKSRVGATRNLV